MYNTCKRCFFMEIETYKWDYTYEWELDKLKELGKQGWEICGSYVSGNSYGTNTAIILKRPCGKVRIVTRDQAQNNGYENER